MNEPSPSRGGDDAAGADSVGGGGERFDEYDDPMAPPREPCECWCLHCERVFMSSAMWFQRVVGARDGFHGFWMCPTPNCSGAGFTFDIFPTDPDHPANAGWHTVEETEGGEMLFDGEPVPAAGLEAADEWDPNEPRYKQLDEDFDALDDEDLEGEEWKHGLAPGERPAAASELDAMSEARQAWEEEQRRYDMPDERPRILDWSDREDRSADGPFNEDDIPF